jgi:hypothetical protein
LPERIEWLPALPGLKHELLRTGPTSPSHIIAEPNGRQESLPRPERLLPAGARVKYLAGNQGAYAKEPGASNFRKKIDDR